MIAITAKQWLNRARVIAADIDNALQAGPGTDREAARAEAENLVIRWAVVKTEIVNAVYKLPDRRERIVLIDFYCNRLTVREIAADLDLTIEQTFRIKRAAIKHLGEALGLG